MINAIKTLKMRFNNRIFVCIQKDAFLVSFFSEQINIINTIKL